LAVIGFRDHHVWKEGGVWYQVIGSGIEGVGGAILLYESPDLIHWKYLHPLLVGDKDETEPVWTGTMWECPQLVPFGEKHVLIISCHDDGNLLYSAYFVGTYSERKFIPETLRVTDLGGYFYAPQTLVDDKGRRLMWGWLQEGRDEETIQDAGWAGVMSLPRAISLRPGDSLSIEPVPELQTLRSKHYRLEGIDLTPKTSSVLEDIKGDRLEIVAEFAPGSAREVGVKVRCSPAGEEQTIISYDRSSEQLAIDRSRSSLSSNVHRDTQGGMLELADHQTLWLHIFLDRSVVEVFANGRECLSERIYPSLADSVGLDLFARGGTAKLNSVDVWELESIWTAK
jgi:beta-fructofuranosidase